MNLLFWQRSGFVGRGFGHEAIDLALQVGQTLDQVGMKLFDLNSREYPEIGSFDFAVFSGVLEYVKEIEDLKSIEPFIIAFGNDSYEILIRNFRDKYRIKKVMHYSQRISKEEYKTHILKTMILENK